MKEGKNMKLIKRITAYLLTFSILLSIGSSVVAGLPQWRLSSRNIQRMKTRHRKC